MKKRVFKICCFSSAFVVALAFSAFAGQWAEDSNGWSYQNDDGTTAKSGWTTIDGTAYYFDDNGYMLKDSVTPDGYKVDSSGAKLHSKPLAISSAPQLNTVTSSPSTVLKEGTYKVGTDIAAGEYILFNTSSSGGYYSINSDCTGTSNSIISMGGFDFNAIVTVNDGEYLQLLRCTLSPIDEVPQIKYTQGTMFKIGYQLPAGEYKLQSNSSYGGYYCVYSSSRNTADTLVTSGDFSTQTTITVEADQYLKLARCTITK